MPCDLIVHSNLQITDYRALYFTRWAQYHIYVCLMIRLKRDFPLWPGVSSLYQSDDLRMRWWDICWGIPVQFSMVHAQAWNILFPYLWKSELPLGRIAIQPSWGVCYKSTGHMTALSGVCSEHVTWGVWLRETGKRSWNLGKAKGIASQGILKSTIILFPTKWSSVGVENR